MAGKGVGRSPESARILAAADHAANALYHCQQSAEKSLKAFLTWHDRPFRKTHNLKELGDAYTLIDDSLRRTAEQAHVLTDYSWKMRYPGDPYEVEEAARHDRAGGEPAGCHSTTVARKVKPPVYRPPFRQPAPLPGDLVRNPHRQRAHVSLALVTVEM